MDLSGLDVHGLVELVLIMVVAVVGKTGGTYAAARIGRLPARSAAMLAVLMNTRGLTELVVLSVGLQLGLLDQELYSIMVVMALVTTAMTGPLLTLLDRRAPAGPPVSGDRGDTRRELGSPAEPWTAGPALHRQSRRGTGDARPREPVHETARRGRGPAERAPDTGRRDAVP
ncbi:cation:proton antiporter [Streptomyces incanus]|uniref:Cation:proton antiporter n=1 Tax=Streptomyces incanus TaxID=887453 RepID=A0ABW0Y420_9ACTN